ncbi:MAG: mechanosensitive ion channel, partial [Mycobacterium sp.]|nr:mechanosensitive ion channel [Mycobacterium sp.]
MEAEMSQRWFVVVLSIAFGAGVALAQVPEQAPEIAPPVEDANSAPALSATQPESASQPLSDAEKIARLQRVVERLRTRVDDLRAQLNAPESEYNQAEAEFTVLDAQFQARKSELEKRRAEGDTEAATTQEADLKDLETKWQLAKDRFDLAIQERKTLQEQIVALEQAAARNAELLKKLVGEPEAVATTQPEQTQPASPVPVAAVATQPASPSQPAAGGAAGPAPATREGPPGASGEGAAEPSAASGSAGPANEELVRAREQMTQKEAEAAQAQEQVKSIAERIEALQKGIALEQKLLETARRQTDNAQGTERTLYDELQRKWQEGVAPADLQDLRQKIADVRERLGKLRGETRERNDRLNRLQSRLAALQADEIGALRESERKQHEAEAARKQVLYLENPFSIRNLLQWALLHGPRILGIVVGMYVVLWISRLLERRAIVLMTYRGDVRTRAERENRARTLLGVFHNAVRVAIIPAGALMILTEVGVNIIPLLGGAAVAGLAVAFGAQNLIRDYFTGFMILLENQYGVNDVVKIADVSGQVERVTLRMTVLRDLEGIVHFIPNGHITTVSNMTHGWSRAVFDIAVAYKEDVDH